MRNLLKVAALFALLAGVFFSCKKTATQESPAQQDEISQQVLDKIYELGFGNKNVVRHPEGYLVEGDIVISNEELTQAVDRKLIRVGEEEQYRTTRTVTGLPRTISIRVNSSLPSRYITAVDGAIARYNALGLLLTFTRVTSGGNIVINPAPSGAGYLASAGFPTASGNPYGSVLVNRSYLDTWNINTVISIIAHEVGHCIGYRHTDYANRAYSCGGSAVNEGQAGVGAIHIPGTPTTNAVAGSWMLACIGNGVNRPFISSDITALTYLY
ncbi:M57 family metalloprotease [Paraflavitalea sp. CAU 1676]|uniref:M57 family metalloprotease n=1 Tax=Paraflavitalea sp. CAU 1676 TaxID=3032598 RepID=UPI0023DAE6E4|nr:M57 family metalloprotease [Paraflavitalea sp. CAU 1676]MDF2192551.1 M57 family metalloprotease [Paraflavitalea sp. CAU 1676]